MKELLIKGLVFSLLLAVMLPLLAPLEGSVVSQSTDKKININTATQAELMELPRIGEKMAQRIIDYRQKNGKFSATTDLLKIKGIGEKIFEMIKDLVTV